MKENVCRIVQEGPRVLVVKNGLLVFDMPWEAALEMASALREQGKKAEQAAKIEKVVEDAKILRNAGAPGNIVGGFVGTPTLLGS